MTAHVEIDHGVCACGWVALPYGLFFQTYPAQFAKHVADEV